VLGLVPPPPLADAGAPDLPELK